MLRTSAEAYVVAWRCGVLALLAATACTTTPGRQGSVTPITQASEAQLAIPDLASLARESTLVIVGVVSGPGTTRELPQPAQTPIGPVRNVSPAPSAGGVSVRVTSYPVNIERVIRGTAAPGSAITVSQSGNPIRDALPSSDDVPLVSGERDVLFLRQADDGTFVIVGGVQGRLTIDAQNRVHLVGSGSPATRGHEGQSLEAFVGDLTRAQ